MSQSGPAGPGWRPLTLQLGGRSVSGAFQVVLMPIVGRFGGRFDQRVLLAIGIVGVTISLWMNASDLRLLYSRMPSGCLA